MGSVPRPWWGGCLRHTRHAIPSRACTGARVERVGVTTQQPSPSTCSGKVCAPKPLASARRQRNRSAIYQGPNSRRQDYTATRPNQKRVDDIAYQRTIKGGLYLAVMIDLSRALVGGAIVERMTTEFVRDALRMTPYPVLLASRAMHAIMSTRGNWYGKACAEGVFHTLKVGAIHRERLPSAKSFDARYLSTST